MATTTVGSEILGELFGSGQQWELVNGELRDKSQAAWTFHRNETPVWVPSGEGGTLAAADIDISVKLTDLWKGLKRKRGNRLG